MILIINEHILREDTFLESATWKFAWLQCSVTEILVRGNFGPADNNYR